MANPIFAGSGVSQYGAAVGTNRAGQLISSHRVEQGHWAGTNQVNGAQFDAVHQKGNVWEITRTDPTTGEQRVGDFTIVSRPRTDGSRGFMVLDLDRDGYQPVSS